MTSRRAAGQPEGQRDPRSSGSSEDNGFGDRPQVVGLQQPQQQPVPPAAPPAHPRPFAVDNLADRRPQITGSLQNLGPEQPPVVPPPVPPRTPQVRQSRGRRGVGPAPAAAARPLPPLPPVRPAAEAPVPPPPALVPRPVATDDDSVFLEDVPARRGDDDNNNDHEDDEREKASAMFARCGRSASRSKSRDDEDEIVAEDVELLDEGPGTSSGRNRLRPPLATTAGLSADSGTGDTGSAEIAVDGTPLQQHETLPAGDDDEEDEDAEGADGVADDELADELDELRRRHEAATGASSTPTGARLASYSGSCKASAKQQVKPFTKDSLDRLENKHVQLVRDYGFQPKRKTSVADGGVLPHKFEPFPSNLYNRPLEEIDSFIYDEVSRYTNFHCRICASVQRVQRVQIIYIYIFRFI